MRPIKAGGGKPLSKVLFAIALDPSVKFGSLEEQLLEIGREFRARGGVFVPLFTKAAGPQLERLFRDARVPILHLDLWTFSFNTLRSLLRIITVFEIEIVHWSFYTPRTPYLWILRILRPGLRHFLTYQDSRWSLDPPRRPFVVRATKRRLFRVFERVFCVSDFLLNLMTREGTWDRVERLRYFVNTERFRPDEEARARTRDEYGVANRFVLIAVAALIPDKGIGLLLQATAELPENIVVWVIGEGPLRESLELLASRLKIADKVHFFGAKLFVESFVRAADVVACPSTWHEALGLINLEAMACGVPVVASNRGGIPEVVIHGDNGLLFTPGSVTELRDCILQLHQDATLRGRLGLTGRARAVESHSWSANREAYLAPYLRT